MTQTKLDRVTITGADDSMVRAVLTLCAAWV